MIKKLVFIPCFLFALLLFQQKVVAADYTNSIGIEFVKIETGCFNMGLETDIKGNKSIELPRHKVCITKPFYLGKTEVTQEQWEVVMGNNPSKHKGKTYPVEHVSWHDVQEFIQKLNKKEGGIHYRLPTEAEWEYAARAGSNSTYYFGNDKNLLGQYAWFIDSKEDYRTHPVAQKFPNQWGLYDIHGNVWEWVQDWYDKNYYKNSPTNDPKGPSSGQNRLIRGGGWANNEDYQRLAYRNLNSPDFRDEDQGFRLLRQP